MCVVLAVAAVEVLGGEKWKSSSLISLFLIIFFSCFLSPLLLPLRRCSPGLRAQLEQTCWSKPGTAELLGVVWGSSFWDLPPLG